MQCALEICCAGAFDGRERRQSVKRKRAKDRSALRFARKWKRACSIGAFPGCASTARMCRGFRHFGFVDLLSGHRSFHGRAVAHGCSDAVQKSARLYFVCRGRQIEHVCVLRDAFLCSEVFCLGKSGNGRTQICPDRTLLFAKGLEMAPYPSHTAAPGRGAAVWEMDAHGFCWDETICNCFPGRQHQPCPGIFRCPCPNTWPYPPFRLQC